jgi:uncharacterized membrane protein
MSVDESDTVGREELNTSEQIADDISAFTGLTSEFYRGEVDRATSWRARLDQTTNWAVVIVAAILTWAFSSPDHPHYVVLIGVFGVTAFLVMEATRYREYDVWRGRVRILQKELLADMYAPDGSGDDDWRTELSSELRNPKFTLSFREAMTHRLRRSYLALLLLLLAAWIARVALLEPDRSWRATASILGVPGEVVTGAVGTFYVVVIALTAWSAREKRVQEFQE